MNVTTFFKVKMFRMKFHPSSVQKPASACEITTEMGRTHAQQQKEASFKDKP